MQLSIEQNPKIQILLIGCGRWGLKILQTLKLHPEVIVDVLDPDPIRQNDALTWGARFPYREKPDFSGYHGIIIASPAHTHRPLIDEIAPLRVPLFVEKPLTLNHKDALALTPWVTHPIWVMHIWMVHPGIRVLAELAKGSKLGTITMLKTIRANWTSPRTDADTVWNFAPHDLTIAQTILGTIPEPRFATAEIHDGVARGMLAVLGAEPTFAFEISNRYADKRREIRLHGTLGVAVMEHEASPTVKVYLGDHHNQPETIPCEEIPITGPSALEVEIRQFLDHILGGPPPISPLADGIKIAGVIQKLRHLANLP